MNFRTLALFAALPTLIASLLIAAPAAEAASYSAFVRTSNVSISSSGIGKVAVACHSKHTCTGKISFRDDKRNPPRVRNYKVKGNRTAYVTVALTRDASLTSKVDPYSAPKVATRDYRMRQNVRLTVNEDSPRNITHYYNRITTETPVSRQDITGTVIGSGVLADDVRVDLIRTIRGGNTQIVDFAEVANGGRYRFSVKLGTNNSAGSSYRLRLSGTDQDGSRRSWFWRGTDGAPTGGGVYLRDGSSVVARKTNDFNADFTYSSISGTGNTRAEVSVVGPPPSFSGGSTTSRELDYPRCGNIFGQTRAGDDRSYTIGFLPTPMSKRYMLQTTFGSSRAFYGAGARRFGSCSDVTKYRYSRDNLITLNGPIANKDIDASGSGNTARINGVFSSAYKPTSQGDRWIRLREKIPGAKILDTPVVAEGQANGSGNRNFNDLPPGQYWVEVGRRTGCSDWYPSRYSNNRAYFRGGDRSSERWKSFSKLSRIAVSYQRLAKAAKPNGANAQQNRIPSGYAGWMYRGYCKAYGTGTINTMTIGGTTGEGDIVNKTTSRDPKGAVVKGRVTRKGGKTKKEMMVRLSSSQGTRIVRADLTDGGGTFYISGLASGKWTISVNSDSWRGIERTFRGKHSVTVRAGHGYNVGTLNFRG